MKTIVLEGQENALGSYVSWFLIIPKHSKTFQRVHENAKNNIEIILNLLM